MRSRMRPDPILVSSINIKAELSPFIVYCATPDDTTQAIAS